MSNDERIKAALKRRPADEREYVEPLAALMRRDEGVQRVKPVTRSRVRTGALPALAAIVVMLALGAGALAAGVLRGPAATAGSHNDFQLTGRVDCFGQSPGYIPGPDAAPSDSCPLMVVAPTGLETATWVLDPSMPYSAGATEIHVLAQEWACNSGQDASGRIVQNVQYGDDAVVVTLAVRPRGGAQTCQGNPATPFVVHLDQPVGSRSLQDGGLWPAATLAKGGQAVVTPSPTPYPSNWHMPMDCTGEGEGPGSFKAASMSAAYDVYCAALPAGWHRESMAGDEQLATMITVTYRGPNGETLTLSEGDLCGAGQSVCAVAGTSAGAAMFGDLEGQLFEAPPGADFALYVAPGKSPSWMATGKGMSLETFKALTAALIIVGK
jgi:hypothetical protein